MSREVKFRAWDLDNFMMYYQDRDHDNGEGPIVWTCQRGEVFFEENQLIDEMSGGVYHEQYLQYRRPEQIVMQYTGIKDVNGTDIYESDILRYRKYNKDGTKNGSSYKIVKWVNGTQCQGFNIGKSTTYEIVGNIYENFKLIESKLQ